jgi:hypothetical protein
MSELQNDDVAIEDNGEVVANPEEGTVLATDSEGQHESIDQVDEAAKQAKATQDIINKKTFEAKQAQRDLQSANDRLKAIEDKERESQAAAVANIPPIPDQYDDDFEQKMADRDAAVLAQATFNSTQAANQREQQSQQQQQERLQQEQIQKAAIAYDARAVELNIGTDELKAAGGTVVQYGLSDDLAMHILSDPDGPLIIKHLAANPQEGFELASMSPYAVGTYLDGVRSKAAALKPKQSNAPAPADTLQGNGVDPEMGKYQNLKGTVYS